MKDIIIFNKELEVLLFILPKVGIATICGGIIGLDRETKNKSAGLRTNILICVGSALLTASSVLIYREIHMADPTRIISTIVTGIGFLGAGTVFKQGNKISGLTTSSFIWVISAIGIMIGLGSTITPIIITIGLYFMIKWLETLKKDESDLI